MSEKSKNILLGVLIVGLVSMTVAYAALSTSLTINGTANVAATKWDIHFEDWARDASLSNVSEGRGTTQALNGAVTKIEGFTATLSKPGDKIVYNFKIANRGTVDAKLAENGFSKTIKVDVLDTDGTTVKTEGTTKTTNDYNRVTEQGVYYTVTCTGDTPLDANATTPASATPATCSLTLEYAQLSSDNGSTAQKSQTAGDDQTVDNPAKKVTIGANWTYVQK